MVRRGFENGVRLFDGELRIALQQALGVRQRYIERFCRVVGHFFDRLGVCKRIALARARQE